MLWPTININKPRARLGIGRARSRTVCGLLKLILKQARAAVDVNEEAASNSPMSVNRAAIRPPFCSALLRKWGETPPKKKTKQKKLALRAKKIAAKRENTPKSTKKDPPKREKRTPKREKHPNLFFALAREN